MISFYHIYLQPQEGITQSQINDQIDLAIDWYKYAPNCWVVKSTSEIERWQTRLKPLVEPDGSLVVLKVDPWVRQGWIAKGFWEWLKKARADD